MKRVALLVVAMCCVAVGARTLKPHPRLFVQGAGDFATFNAKAATNELWGSYRAFMIADADRRLLQTANVVPKKAGKRLLGPCWEVTYRLTSLATAFRLTGDRRYFERARTEMLAACAWETWNPSHYLDVASIQIGLAIAYDWFYDELTPEERATVRAAIVVKGWDEAEQTRKTGWKRAHNNWQGWCWCGVSMAALAIYEDVPDRAEAYLSDAVKLLPLSLGELAPNGAYPEGVSYWGAGVGRVVDLIACLESATGEPCALADLPGFLASGSYPCHLYDPMGFGYNYGDASAARFGIKLPQVWLARRANRLDWLVEAVKVLKTRPWEAEMKKDKRGRMMANSKGYGVVPFLLALWMGDAADGAPQKCALPTDYSGLGANPVVTMRTAWDDPNAAFVGVKGGKAKMSHGHMDAGSFIYTAHGVRWAVDLGSQDYLSIEKLGMGLWDCRQTGDRWKVFRLSEKAHNNVTIGDRPLNVEGFGVVTNTVFGADRSTAQIDLTAVLRGQVQKAVREVTLDKKSGALTIVDTFAGVPAGEQLRWKMFTRAKGVVGAQGVRLEQAGHHLDMQCRSSAAWEVADFSQPLNTWDCANPGLQRVSLVQTAPADGVVQFAVTLTPVD
ncbi:MAG: heparinase II/III family protein [Kiritimatiellae bacterium]|nr:heparinase II/III family protein [Kiritimatiellia bacterium]